MLRSTVPCKWRFSFVPFGRLLVSVGEFENDVFSMKWTGNLQANRQTTAREAARDGDGRQSPDIKRPCVAQKLKFALTQKFRILSHFGDGGCDHRRGGSHNKIDIFEYVTNLLANMCQLLAGGGDLVGADVFPGSNSANGFGLVKLGASSYEFSMVGVGLGCVKLPLSGDSEIDFA